ncbi:MAG: protein kinase, partial [Planctomycetes bacterium]|nr:protein kinase [Planctomycetota bacterium]
HLGLHYLIMEYVQGETARQRVERKGPLAVPEALQVVYEASLGLGEAHRMGIVHRDIKPDNLLVSVRGQVKVADLGLAKPSIGSGQSVLSMAGQVMGTPPYMPPEQWGEGIVTNASDVWAMGAVLFYLLTAREAIQGDSLANIMSRIVLQDFPDIRELRPDVPESVAALLAKATAKAPGERFLDAYELARAIAELPEHRISLVDSDAGTTEVRTMLSPPPMPQLDEIKQLLRDGKGARRRPASESTARDDDGDRERRTAGSRKPWAAILAATLLLGGGAGGWVYREELFGGTDDPGPGNGTQARQPDLAATDDVTALEREGRFVAALVAARAAFKDGGGDVDEDLIARLRSGAIRQLAPTVTRIAPDGPVPRDREVQFVGTYDGPRVAALLLGGERVVLNGTRFAKTLRPPASGQVALRARITDEDEVDIATWTVTFEDEGAAPPPPAAVAFVGDVSVDPPLGERNTTDRFAITLVGRATEPELELLLGKGALPTVEWQPDGTFRAGVLLPEEGRNQLRLALRRPGGAAGASTTVEVVRLTQPPQARIVTPDAASLSTDRATITIEVEADEWTNAVTARLRERTVTFERTQQAGRWRAAEALPLADGRNPIAVVATNLTGKQSTLPLDVTCTAPTPSITAVTLTAGDTRRQLQPGERVCVRERPSLAVSIDDDAATLQVDGASRQLSFLLPDGEGPARTIELRAVKGPRRSEPWSVTVVVDAEQPTVSVDPVEPVAPGSEVTLRGSWTDNVGVTTVGMGIAGGALGKVTRTTPTSGRFELTVRAGSETGTVPVVTRDEAGNARLTLVPVPVRAAAPDTAKPATVEPDAPATSKLNAAIDASLFEPVGDLNAAGFPPALRHKQTRIELVAIDMPNGGKPALYAGKRVVSQVQWNGDGDDDNQGSLTWLDVAAKLEEPRFAGLSLPTKQQWQRIRSATGADLQLGGAREWLAQSPDESVDMRPLWDGKQIVPAKLRFSDSYTGFRVVFAPR